MAIDLHLLIAALRDTASKATETVSVEVPDFGMEMARPHFNRTEPLTRTETRDAFSKDWIAGRLLGMADTIEALASESAES